MVRGGNVTLIRKVSIFTDVKWFQSGGKYRTVVIVLTETVREERTRRRM